MQLAVAPDILLELRIDKASNKYYVVGPSRQWNMLDSACSSDRSQAVHVTDMEDCEGAEQEELTVGGNLSPLSPVTVSKDARRAAAIPDNATTFAFAYPGGYAWAQAASMPSPESYVALDRKLETLNLADEVWAYLLLVGGFLFFDDEGTLIQANALTLVPSDHMMKFDGPHAPNRDALQTLREAGRMKAVTLDALESMNFKSFGKPPRTSVSTSVCIVPCCAPHHPDLLCLPPKPSCCRAAATSGWVHSCEVLNGNQLSIEEGVRCGILVASIDRCHPHLHHMHAHAHAHV